jgi:hypothetical protein
MMSLSRAETVCARRTGWTGSIPHPCHTKLFSSNLFLFFSFFILMFSLKRKEKKKGFCFKVGSWELTPSTPSHVHRR